ncbi:MAG: 3-deoxy-D-manno-octulosonic acid kinase [Pseudohongiella sp.]|nr:3-deoxy-D-manno-octulosonic acid kinase [Pseudohongiella sp.]
MRTTQYRQKNSHVLYNQTVFSNFPDELFSQPGSIAQNTCTDTSLSSGASTSDVRTDSQGRGTVVFFEHEQTPLILKRYHRGGLLGKFVKNTYIFNGLNRTRMWREFKLLATMRELGLPVPKPVAVRCERSSLFCYQGQMIAERIANSRTLAEILCRENLPEKTWEAIGMVIRRFHRNAIEHADLNACNILLTAQGQIFLIDFDKSTQHKGGDDSWCQSNLSRLRRSLNKWKRRETGFHFDVRHWSALEKGYQGARDVPVTASAAADAAR